MKFIDILPSRFVSLISELFASRVWNELRGFLSSFTNRWVSVIWVCVVVIPPIFFVAEIVSIKQYISESANSQWVGSQKDALVSQLKNDSSLETVNATYPAYSSLIAYRGIKVTAQRAGYDNFQFIYENVASYRYDIIIVFTGLWLVILYALRTLGSKTADYSTLDVQKEKVASSETPAKTYGSLESSISEATDNIAVLKDEVHFARRRALDVHHRSSIIDYR